MRYLDIAVLLTICVLLSADNELEVVWQQHGEQANDNFGMSVISLDFNGDNIDDLAVNAYRHYIDPEYIPHRGRLYLYYGSDTGLSDTPDLTISCPVDTIYDYRFSWMRIENLGDMNGDNCDELGYIYSERTFEGGYQYFHSYRILEGNTVNDTLTDYIYESDVPYSEIDIHPLGDINGDGYDDAGITEFNDYLTYSIIYGGSFEKVVFVDSIYTRMSTNRGFRGLGDVNNDGYDDFSFCYEGENVQNPDETFTYNYFFRFFWGGTVQDTIPDASLHYTRHTYSYSLLYELVPVGDWDSDGYDDFTFKSYDLNEDFEALGTRLWRGGETIDWNRYTYIETSNFLSPQSVISTAIRRLISLILIRPNMVDVCISISGTRTEPKITTTSMDTMAMAGDMPLAISITMDSMILLWARGENTIPIITTMVMSMYMVAMPGLPNRTQNRWMTRQFRLRISRSMPIRIHSIRRYRSRSRRIKNITT